MIRISVGLPVAALAALLLPVALHGQENRPVGSVDPQRIVPNDNRRPAGRLEDGVLTLSLTAREGMWHPHGFERPGIPVGAFAENEGRLQMPGPLIRVPVGTEVRTTVRNARATRPCRPITFPTSSSATWRRRTTTSPSSTRSTRTA